LNAEGEKENTTQATPSHSSRKVWVVLLKKEKFYQFEQENRQLMIGSYP
jgi:hypothetical protein